MNKKILLGGCTLLAILSAACSDIAKTSASAPDTVETNGEPPSLDTILANESDASSSIRRAQANSDIRAREQRHSLFGNDERSDRDLASEVRDKLEVNLPTSQLTVDAEDGAIAIAGFVQTQSDLAQVESLAQQIQGVESVTVKAVVDRVENEK